MKVKFTIALGLFVIWGLQSFAQKSDTLAIERDSISGTTFISFDVDSKNVPNISNTQVFLKELHKSGPETSFVLKKKSVDNLGIEHQTFEQFYKGLRIIGAQYKIHAKGGKVNSANGNYATLSDIDVIPVINEKGYGFCRCQTVLLGR